MTTSTSADTEAVLAHHLQAFAAGDLDAILGDYRDDSVLHTPEESHRGLRAIRSFFEQFMANAPADLIEKLEMLRQEVDGEVAYIVWRSPSHTSFATDTFVVRGGKIVVQTYAAAPPLLGQWGTVPPGAGPGQ